ncbi:hypothetical protein TNCT6_63810 [Streptomyces sp. 6-11-2]|nr:hypothetical protein TNCT6_63810 [Streptomyces sp. 6-11-2]
MQAMTHRPNPVRTRALRQIMRRHRNEIPLGLLPDARSAQPEPGEYRLSTRRPGLVSSPSQRNGER